MHRSRVSAHPVHVLHLPGAVRPDAHHVDDWQLEPDHVGPALVRGSLDKDGQLRSVEVVYG